MRIHIHIRTIISSVCLLMSLCPLSPWDLIWSEGINGSIHEYHLPNGLHLLVRVDTRAPVVMSQMWYQVGSSEERLGETGISHFLEHMMFQGTETFPPGELTRLITTNGGQVDSYTLRDATVYSEFMPKDELPLIFQLESDRMQNLNFTAQQFEKEKNAILLERHVEIDDRSIGYLFQTVDYVANMGSPYNNPVIGWESDIQQLSSQDLMGWYHEYYDPNLATLVIVGDVDPDQVYELAQQYFGNFKEAMPLDFKTYSILDQTGVKHVLIKRARAVPTLVMTFRVPSMTSSQLESESFDLEVLKNLLGNMPSSRLRENLVHGKAIASDIEIYYDPLMRYSTLFTILARPMPNVSFGELEGAIFDQVAALEQTPPDDAELARVKKYTESQHLYDLDSLMGQASLLGRLETVGLPWQTADDYLLRIDAVQDEDLIATANTYLNQDNLVDAELVPVDENTESPDQNPSQKSTQKYTQKSAQKSAWLEGTVFGEVFA